ncbi:phage regulatory CII family protein [Marinobacterium stanieri]|uniref:phage regulatory CII family protein n=1 Tax=Marinobacterium stanieri TaxID=49186 RepID=UPI000255782A|nr:phage regulatory CII family protein [Marinobacterium stanieri]
METLDSAIYDTVHADGADTLELATQMGMSRQILLNKANPQCDTNKFSPHELVALQLHTGNRRIAEAMCMEVGMNALAPASNKPQSILNAMLTVTSECGDVARVIEKSLVDGRLTARERSEVQREINEAIDSLMGMRLAIKNHPNS